MNRKKINYGMLGFLLLFCSCEMSDIPDEDSTASVGSHGQAITLEASANDYVTLFIFRKSGDSFLYQTDISSGWDAQGKIVYSIDPGMYRFLFVKTPWTGIQLSPDVLTTSTDFDRLRFEARPVPGRENEVFPVDELFLPQDPSTSDPLEIKGGETIACTLTRAVCRSRLLIKRGEQQNGEYLPAPYPEGETILDNLKSIRLELDGVGTSADLYSTYGKGIMITDWNIENDNLTTEGFAELNGPFFFPPASSDKIIEAKVEMEMETGMLTSPVMKVESVRRNDEVDIVVWLPVKQTNNTISIGITADTRPITDSVDGDIGFWE